MTGKFLVPDDNHMYVFPILAGHETCPLSRFGVSGVAELPFPFPCETKLSWAILGISPVAGDKGSSVLLVSLYVVVLLLLVPSPRNGGKIPDEGSMRSHCRRQLKPSPPRRLLLARVGRPNSAPEPAAVHT